VTHRFVLLTLKTFGTDKTQIIFYWIQKLRVSTCTLGAHFCDARTVWWWLC